MSWNFKDNLTIDNNKNLKWLDPLLIVRNIIGLDSNSNLDINSGNGDIYFNSNSNNLSNTFINVNNSGNTLINSKLAVGINTTQNLISNIVLPTNGWIGLNTTIGSNSGYLGLAASSSLSNLGSSRVLMYGNEASGQLNLFSGNNTAGNIQFYTGNDSLKMQILNSGSINFQPDGTTIRMVVSNSNTTLTNKLIITDTSISTNQNSGALQVAGGIGVNGNSFINGSLTINSLIGNINFNSTAISTSYSSGATYFNGGVGIICSVSAVNQYNGGALSVAGGLALGQNAMLGGNITIFDSSVSTNALSGSGIFYGGIGINGQTNIRSGFSPQIRLIPIINGNETSIFFGNTNNYTTTGSWSIGQSINNVGSGNFGIYSLNNGTFITLDTNINLNKYTNLNNTLNFNSTINNLITFQNSQGNTNWSIGTTLGNFQLSLFNSNTNGILALSSDNNTGNITIYSTANSNSSTFASLIVNGGTSIQKNLLLNGNLNFNSSLISNSTIDNNSFSFLTLTSTQPSALTMAGGITINSSIDSTSITNGGSFLTMGGGSFGASVYIKNTLYTGNLSSSNAVLTNNSSTNLINTNQNTINSTISNLINVNSTINSLTSTNITSTNNVATNSTISQLVSLNFTSSTANITGITSSNLLLANYTGINSTITNSIITNASITNIINTNSSITSLNTTFSTISNSVFTNISSGTGNFIGITSANINFTGNLYQNGTVYISSQWLTYGNNIAYTTGNVGINTTNPSFTLDVNGTTRIVSGLTSTFNSNTLGNLFSTGGNVGIGIALPMAKLHLATNSTFNNIVFEAGNSFDGGSPGFSAINFNGYFNLVETRINPNKNRWRMQVQQSSTNDILSFDTYNGTTLTTILTMLTNGNIGINTASPAYTLDISGSNRITGTLLATNNSNTLGNLYTTGGNIGINIVSPGATLDINGSVKVNTGFNSTFNSNTLGNLFTTGGNIGIYTTNPNQTLELNSITYTANQNKGLRISTRNYISTVDASYRYIDLRLVSDPTLNFRGSIFGTLAGGTATEYEYMSFSQNSYTNIYSRTIFTDNTSSSNSSSGSVTLSGGLSINCGTNATNISNGGALTILGGASVAGDLIVGGSILYANAAAASSTFAYLTLTSTDQSINIANGSLITFGGISIQSTADATSSTSGYGLTVAGGVGIGASLYVGTTGYIPKIVSTNASLVNTTISNGYITNGLNTPFNSNTIGNLFTTGGNIGINIVNPLSNLHVNGQVYVQNTTGLLKLSSNGIVSTNTSGSFIAFYLGNSNLTISSAGNIGINNTDPNFSLDITGNVNFRSTQDSINSTTASTVFNGGISISKNTNASSTTSGGALTVAGGMAVFKDLLIGGTVSSSSDERLKTNLRPIDNILDKISNIRTIKYNKIDSTDKDYYGFIAQDFAKDFPELLSQESPESMYSLAYDRVTVLLMKCIKELAQQNKELAKLLIN